MGYRINLGSWNSVFAVPSAVVDKHLKLAQREHLQVLLWMLRHSGDEISPEVLQQEFNLTKDSVLDILDYWVDCGIFARLEDVFSPPDTSAPVIEAVLANPIAPIPAPELPQKRMVRPDGLHVAARIQESEAIRFLMQEAEATLGKTLSPALSSALLAICDDYGLPAEVVAMILHYAKSVGKTGTAYIDAVARDWAQSGIFSIEAAEQKLTELSQRRLAWGKVESAAGLPRRSPTKKEEDAAYRWVCEWGLSPEMLASAYERCADRTGKFSLAYMNKILERWHKNGFTTLSQVQAEDERKQNAKEKEKSYDIDEYERMSFFDLPEDL